MQTAIVGGVAVSLGVLLGIADGIWASAAHVEFVGGVLLVALVCTFGASIVEARGLSEGMRQLDASHGLLSRVTAAHPLASQMGSSSGFTLIELMVVLLILAILLAIAIPTFLGVTKSANDRGAQSNLNTALLNAKSQFQNNSQAYSAAGNLTTALNTAEPSLSFVTGASTDQQHVSVAVSTDNTGLVLAGWSKQTQNCWIVQDVPTQVSLAAANPPWANAQAPAVAVDATLSIVAGNAGNVTFLNSSLGTTYAEIKGSTSGQCLASGPAVTTGESYRWSKTAFPSI